MLRFSRLGRPVYALFLLYMNVEPYQSQRLLGRQGNPVTHIVQCLLWFRWRLHLPMLLWVDGIPALPTSQDIALSGDRKFRTTAVGFSYTVSSH